MCIFFFNIQLSNFYLTVSYNMKSGLEVWKLSQGCSWVQIELIAWHGRAHGFIELAWTRHDDTDSSFFGGSSWSCSGWCGVAILATFWWVKAIHVYNFSLFSFSLYDVNFLGLSNDPRNNTRGYQVVYPILDAKGCGNWFVEYNWLVFVVWENVRWYVGQRLCPTWPYFFSRQIVVDA